MTIRNLCLILCLCTLLADAFYAAPSSASGMEEGRVTVALPDSDWVPFIAQGANDSPVSGILPDLLRALFEDELGVRTRFVLFPWPRAQKQVQDGEADVFITIPTPERQGYAAVTAIPMYRMRMVLFTYANHPRMEEILSISGVDDLKRLELDMVSNLGNGWHKANIENMGVKTHKVQVDEQLVRFLAFKRADGMIDADLTMSLLVEELGFSSKIVKTPIQFGLIDFYVMVGKRSPMLDRLDEINEALYRMRDKGTFDRVRNDYRSYLE